MAASTAFTWNCGKVQFRNWNWRIIIIWWVCWRKQKNDSLREGEFGDYQDAKNLPDYKA